MRAYWRLEDDDKALRDIAAGVLTGYIFFNDGKTRGDALVKAAEFAGFKISIVKWNKDGEVLFSYDDNDFSKFQQEIRGISRGKFEYEVLSIARIISKWKEKNYAKLPLLSKILLKLKRV